MFFLHIKLFVAKNKSMKKMSKKDKLIIISTILFVVAITASFIAIAVIYSKNSTLVLSGFVRAESIDGSEMAVVLRDTTDDTNKQSFVKTTANSQKCEFNQKPIFQKTFSEMKKNKNLTPIVFSSVVGNDGYGYKITLTNTDQQELEFSINLVQKGTEKECCLPKEIEVLHSNDHGGFEAGTKCSGILQRNEGKDIIFLFRSKNDLTQLCASPCSEFEIFITSRARNK